MGRSKHCQRGKRVNGEIWARGCYQVVHGKVYPDAGGEPCGGPSHKRDAKREVARLRRRQDKKLIRSETEPTGSVYPA